MFTQRVLWVAAALAVIGPIAAASAYDSDGDGIDDHLDVCCGTPAGTPVDDSGRPIGDLDRDCDVDLIDFAALQASLTGELPRCPSCMGSGDCPGDHYCAKLLGDCQAEGTCRPRPLECSDIWEPVCACDGLTYANSCFAALVGQSVEHEGECPPSQCQSSDDCDSTQYCDKAVGDCDGTGICEQYPWSCPPIGGPVCGCDGVTYDFDCAADLAGVSVAFEGECPPPSCQSNADCDQDDFCRKDVGDCDGIGLCQQRPGGCIPSGNQVCGCDGNTYDDSCAAHIEGVSVASEGPCQ